MNLPDGSWEFMSVWPALVSWVYNNGLFTISNFFAQTFTKGLHVRYRDSHFGNRRIFVLVTVQVKNRLTVRDL